MGLGAEALDALALPRPQDQPTRLFLVDDLPAVRRGLRLLFSLEPDLAVCGEAGTEQEALTGILTLKPDLAIVDLTLKGGDGFALIGQLQQSLPELRTACVRPC